MPVDPKRAESLFHRALELPPADRPAFLAGECGDDAELRARVERLLAAHDELGEPATSAPPTAGPTATSGDSGGTEGHTPGPDSGTVIGGRYKLIEEIGEGGMGTVWMARQTEPVKRVVAVKLIKAGMDSRAVLARFEAERQALALMDHPNIAKVLDAGATPDGRPYFVMELVKGVPITRYCDDHKLTPRERLELFVPVCRAIQHAHQKGVIHRDVKPSNVLVALYDDRPVPKVIDFGVAKATGQPLTDKTLATGFGAVVGTPEYMSPEQASFNNLDIDTRSDVYSLGVLLYELLAGSTPFSRRESEKAGLIEILRAVREQEPPRPSTRLSTADALPTLSANRGTEPAKLTRLLRGELDWIVMKCLEKDRSRRYGTADGFAADVLRYLAGEPVQAATPSATYRLRKLYRRNRTAVWVAAAFAAVLVAGATTSTVLAIRASRNAGRAAANERAANDNAATAAANETRANDNAAAARREAAAAAAERERVRRLLYAANFGRIQDALREERFGRVRRLLAETRPGPGEPDLRGIEWHYVNHLVNGHRDVAQIHPGAHGAVNWHSDSPVLSPDGRWAAAVATAYEKADPAQPHRVRPSRSEVRAWDVTAGSFTPITSWTVPAGVGGGGLPLDIVGGRVAFARSVWTTGKVDEKTGRAEATHEFGKSVTVFDAATGRELATLALGAEPTTSGVYWGEPLTATVPTQLDPTGERLAVITQTLRPPNPPLRAVEVWDVARKERVFEVPPADDGLPCSVALAPGGRRLAVQYLRLPPPGQAKAPPTRSLLQISVWDLGGVRPVFELPTGTGLLPARPFSPDGRRLAVMADRGVVVYDAETGRPEPPAGGSGSPREMKTPVLATAFSPDGSVLAAGDMTGEVTLFGPTGAAVGRFNGHDFPITALAFRADLPRLVSLCREGKVKEWDWTRGRRAAGDPAHALKTTDPSGRFVLTVAGGDSPREFAVRDVISGKRLFGSDAAVPGSPLPVASVSGAFSPDGRRLSVSIFCGLPRGPDGRPRGPDWARWVGPSLLNPAEGFSGVARVGWFQGLFARPPRRTVTFDVPSGEVLLDRPVPGGQSFSPDGRYAVGYEGDYQLPAAWDLDARPARRVPLEAPAGRWAYWQHAFGADGRTLTALAATHSPPGAPPPPDAPAVFLHRWDLTSGRLVTARPLALRAADWVRCDGALSPDGTRCVAVPESGVPLDDFPGGTERYDKLGVRVWDLRADGEAVSRVATPGLWLRSRESDDVKTPFYSDTTPHLTVKFTPDGRRLVVVGAAEARVWDLAADGPPVVLAGVRGSPEQVAVSDDGRRLVMLLTRPLAPPDPSGVQPPPGPPDLRVWDLTSGQELLACPLPFARPEWAGHLGTEARVFDGKHLPLLWDGPNGVEIGALDGSPPTPPREAKQ